MLRIISLFSFLLFGSFLCCAQQINVVDINQMFRPSLSVSHDFGFPSSYGVDQFGNSTNADWQHHRTFISGIVPLTGRLGLDIDFNPKKLLKPKSLLKIRAYQLFFTFSLERTHLQTPIVGAVDDYHDFLSVGTGVSMVRYRGKKQAAFYSANILIAENQGSFDDASLRFTGIWGNVIMKNLKRQYFYGVVFSYTQGFNIPIPFGGLAMKLDKKNTLVAILPVQISFAHKYNRKWKQSVFVGLNAFQTGYSNNFAVVGGSLPLNQDYDINLTSWHLRLGTKLKYKASKRLQIMAFGGLNTATKINLKTDDQPTTGKLSAGASTFAGISLYYTFHQSLVRSILDKLSVEWD